MNNWRPWKSNAEKLALIQAYSVDGLWKLPPKGDRHFNIKLSRNTTIALIVSLLIHAIVIFFAFPELIKPSAEITPKAISVTLSNPEPQAAFITPPPPPAPKKERKQKTKIKAPDIMTAKNPEPSSTVTPPPVKSSESKPTPAPNQPVDMMSLVNANRQRRQTEENVASRENAAAVAKERGISQEDARDALIKKNLAQDGTNGIFQIKEIQLHYAQFSFKGWKNNINNARLEIIEVQAGPNENIERAIVKKMIAIIRREYSGDFNWESPHLGRMVILSARLEDNAGLEDFLIREFFGPGAKYGGR